MRLISTFSVKRLICSYSGIRWGFSTSLDVKDVHFISTCIMLSKLLGPIDRGHTALYSWPMFRTIIGHLLSVY